MYGARNIRTRERRSPVTSNQHQNLLENIVKVITTDSFNNIESLINNQIRNVSRSYNNRYTLINIIRLSETEHIGYRDNSAGCGGGGYTKTIALMFKLKQKGE